MITWLMKRLHIITEPHPLKVRYEQLQQDPDFVSHDDYMAIYAEVTTEPPDFTLITDSDYTILISRVMGSGFIEVTGGGWQLVYGESYVMSSTGHTPTVNRHTDPREFARKQYALSEMIKHLNELYRKGILLKVKHELEQEIKQDVMNG